MAEFEKMFHGSFWGSMMTRFKNDEKIEATIEGIKKMEAFFTKHLQGDYFSGEAEPMYIDIHIFPLVEKLVAYEGSSWDERVKKLDVQNNCPKILAYVTKIAEHPIFKPWAMKKNIYHNLMKKFDRMPEGVKAQLDIDMLEETAAEA
mmetsp:Transcript_15492/g.23795  ORF Transcript_15492/g.23795 Transcript_15492/m.23795 type:complete len:147 (-) Transcript_15492:256-696(-)